MSNTVLTNNTTLETVVIQESCSVDIKEKESTNTLEVTSSNTLEIAVPEPGYDVTIADSTIDIVLDEEPSVLIINEAGPQGPAGTPENETMFAKRVDFVGDTIIYKGEAVVGSPENAFVWRLRKLIIGTDDDVTEIWAQGNDNFDKAWTNRLSEVYS